MFLNMFFIWWTCNAFDPVKVIIRINFVKQYLLRPWIKGKSINSYLPIGEHTPSFEQMCPILQLP